MPLKNLSSAAFSFSVAFNGSLAAATRFPIRLPPPVWVATCGPYCKRKVVKGSNPPLSPAASSKDVVYCSLKSPKDWFDPLLNVGTAKSKSYQRT